MAEQRERELAVQIGDMILDPQSTANADDVADLIAAHVAEAVKPFAQAIVDSWRGTCGMCEDPCCQFCQEDRDELGNCDHAEGCIVPVAMKVLEEGE
jgi:hypothetical protein